MVNARIYQSSGFYCNIYNILYINNFRESNKGKTKISNGILADTADMPGYKEKVKITEKNALFREFRRPGAEPLTKKGETHNQTLKFRAKLLKSGQKGEKGDEVTCSTVTELMTRRSDNFST